jgi:hypothetical protein
LEESEREFSHVEIQYALDKKKALRSDVTFSIFRGEYPWIHKQVEKFSGAEELRDKQTILS